jgi:hypothetical protein
MRDATIYFPSHTQQGLPTEGLCTAGVGHDAQEILEAGLMAASTGHAVSLRLPGRLSP